MVIRLCGELSLRTRIAAYHADSLLQGPHDRSVTRAVLRYRSGEPCAARITDRSCSTTDRVLGHSERTPVCTARTGGACTGRERGVDGSDPEVHGSGLIHPITLRKF